MVRRDAIEEAAELARERPTLVGRPPRRPLRVGLPRRRVGSAVRGRRRRGRGSGRGRGRGAARAASSRCSGGSRRTSTRTSTAHLDEPVRSVVVEAGQTARRAGPRRARPGSPTGATSTARAGGASRSRARSPSTRSLRLLSSLPEGVTELGCHPAAEPEEGSSYSVGAAAGAGGALRPSRQGGGRGRGHRAALVRVAVGRLSRRGRPGARLAALAGRLSPAWWPGSASGEPRPQPTEVRWRFIVAQCARPRARIPLPWRA